MKKCIAYDFDGTIYDGDSSIDFYIFVFLRRPYILILWPVQILYFLFYLFKVVDKTRMKEIFFSYLKIIQNKDQLLKRFWEINMKKIKSWYLKKDHKMDIIISASTEFLLKIPAEKLKVSDLIASEVNIDPADISTVVGYYSNIVSELHTFKSSGSSELISLAENDSASVSLTKLPIEESTLAIVAHTEIPKTITVSDMEYTCEDIIGEQLSETLVIPISILRNESTNTKTGNVKVATLQYTHEETTKDVSISVTYELEYTATTTTVTLTVANTFDSSPTVIGTTAVKDVMYAAENVLGTFPAVDLFTEYRFTPEQEEQMLTLSGGEILPVYSISSSQPVAQTIYEFNAVDSVYKKTTDTVPSYEEVLGSSIEEFEENVTYYERSGSSPNYVYTETDDTTPDSTKTYYTRKDYRLRYEEAVADYATGATTFIGNKSYFLYIDTEDVTHATALAFTSNSSTPSVIVLGDSFKFTESALLADVFDEIFTKVKALDSEAVYNYTFQPSENDLIENPLLPRTFWDKNHVYNSNIIAQLNLNSADNINYRFITSK